MRSFWMLPLAAVVLFSAVSAPLCSEASLEDLIFLEIPTVITASLSSQKIDKVPGTMTVLTQEEIRLYGLRTLLDVFNIIPGFDIYIIDSGAYSVNIRGYQWSGGILKVMIDGNPVNNMFTGAFDAYMRYSLENVKQIEIIRGPGSSLYGTNALFAVVNIITKKDEGTKVTLGGGGFGNKSADIYHAGKVNRNFSYSIKGSYFSETGDLLSYNTDFLSGYGEMLDGYGLNTGKLSYAPNSRYKRKNSLGMDVSLKYKNWQVDLSHSDNTLAWTEGYVNVQSEGDDDFNSQMSYAVLQYFYELPDNSSLTAKARYKNELERYYGQMFPSGFTYVNTDLLLLGQLSYDINGDGAADSWPNGGFFDSRMRGTTLGSELLYQKNIGRHSVSLGSEYRLDKVDDVSSDGNILLSNLTKLPDGTIITGSDPRNWLLAEGKSEKIWAAFAQDIFEIADKLSLIAGIRYDNYELAGEAVSPRAALIWNFHDDRTLKLSYGKAFFAPNVFERYCNVTTFLGDPNIKPAKVTTFEAEIQNSYSNPLHYSLVYYNSVLADKFEGPSNGVYFNVPQDSFYSGFETEAQFKVYKRVVLWGNYSIEFTDQANVKYTLKLANAGASFKTAKHCELSAYAHYWGVNENSAFEDPQVNVTLTYSGIKNTGLSLQVNNLGATTHYSKNTIRNILGGDSSDWAFEGRQLLAKASYKF